VAAGVETTEVWFRTLSETEISAYVASGEPLDRPALIAFRAGALCWSAGWKDVFFNVVGLPLVKLLELLRRLGADLL
jgi:septum formation protein